MKELALQEEKNVDFSFNQVALYPFLLQSSSRIFRIPSQMIELLLLPHISSPLSQ